MTNRLKPHLIAGVVLCAIAAHAAEHVRNPARPSGSAITLQLEELWRVGGEDEEILFGQVIRAAVDEAGNIYILDSQLCHVEVFNPNGEHLRTLSREGEGPGEIRLPADMIFLPDSTIGIITRFPGKLTILARNGDSVGTHMISTRDATEGGFTAAHYGALAGDKLIIIGNEIRETREGRARTWYVGQCDLEGNELVRLHAYPYFTDAQRPVMVERNIIADFLFTCATSRDGRVYLAPLRDEYKIQVYAPDGSLERTIVREYEGRERVAIEKKRIHDILEMWGSRRGGNVELIVEQDAAAVRGIRVTDSGELWVTSGQSGFKQPDGIFKTYDVFDQSGQFARQVSVRCEGNPLDDELFFLRDDLAVMIKAYHPTFYAMMGRVTVEGEGEEATNMEIIAYRVPRDGR